MRTALRITGLIVVLVGLIAALHRPNQNHTRTHSKPHPATGEWSIQIPVPHCDDVGNVQVIWPQRDGDPVTVECDQMTINAK